MDGNMDITQSIIVISRVLIIEAALEKETRCWDIGDNPFSVPYWLGIPLDGRGPKPEVWVFFVSLWQISLQCSYYVGIGGEGIYVGKGKVVSAMEYKLQSIAWRGAVWQSVVEAAGRMCLVLFFP